MTVSSHRKRKFEQFVKGTKLAASSALPTKESDNQNVKLGNIWSSYVPCLLNSADTIESFYQQNSQSSNSTLTSEYSFQQKQVNTITNITSLDDGTKCNSYDNNGSVHSPNLLSPENLTTQDEPLVNFNEVHSPNSSSSEDPNHKIQQAFGIIDSDDIKKPVPVVDFIDSPKNLLSLEDRNKKLEQIVRLVSDGDQLPRPVIPIGSKFQVDVPEWTGLVNRKNLYGSVDDSENLRFLGTQIWPLKGKSIETCVKEVGKGRPDSCTCVSPGSTDCIRSHILTNRILLQSEIGPAFKRWKFDEMGEVVSKSWTLNGRRKFESLVKKNPLWNGTNFWELALKHFPSKSKKNLLSYYYNVFIPRRMSQQTRSSPNEIHSDDDQADDDPIEE
uniref:ELM2 domain-containing protein n=1 Tax=Fagus sylvatica TaxID=28930 RepID=A0A2N9FBH5_FAGSY